MLSPSGKRVAMIATVKGKHTLPLDNGRVANAIFGFYGVHEQAGHWYAYVGALQLNKLLSGETYVNESGPRLTRIDLETNKLERIAEPNKNGTGWLLDRSGDILANESYNDSEKIWTLFAGPHSDKPLVQLRDAFHRNGIIGQGCTAGTVLYGVRA